MAELELLDVKEVIRPNATATITDKVQPLKKLTLNELAMIEVGKDDDKVQQAFTKIVAAENKQLDIEHSLFSACQTMGEQLVKIKNRLKEESKFKNYFGIYKNDVADRCNRSIDTIENWISLAVFKVELKDEGIDTLGKAYKKCKACREEKKIEDAAAVSKKAAEIAAEAKKAANDAADDAEIDDAETAELSAQADKAAKAAKAAKAKAKKVAEVIKNKTIKKDPYLELRLKEINSMEYTPPQSLDKN